MSRFTQVSESFNKLCRICLASDAAILVKFTKDYQDIVKNTMHLNVSSQLKLSSRNLKVAHFSFDFQIETKDPFYKAICTSCESTIIRVDNIKKTAQSSDKFVRQMVMEGTPPKVNSKEFRRVAQVKKKIVLSAQIPKTQSESDDDFVAEKGKKSVIAKPVSKTQSSRKLQSNVTHRKKGVEKKRKVTYNTINLEKDLIIDVKICDPVSSTKEKEAGSSHDNNKEGASEKKKDHSVPVHAVRDRC